MEAGNSGDGGGVKANNVEHVGHAPGMCSIVGLKVMMVWYGSSKLCGDDTV